VVVIVASALVISAAVAHSGTVEILFRHVTPFLTTVGRQIVALVGSVTVLSAFVKNIGALAMFMPVAFQFERKGGTPVSKLLMPMSFGSLLGGTMTLIGTSPNVIVSKIREQTVGQPFAMFDFLPVGAGIAAAGVLFLVVGHRLLPARRGGVELIESAVKIRYTTETKFRPDSPFIGRTVGELEAESEGEVVISAVIRERFRRYTPSPDWTLFEDDILLLQGEANALDRLVTRTGLVVSPPSIAENDHQEHGFVEAVVTAGAAIIDMSAAQLAPMSAMDIELIAFSRGGQQITRRLDTIRFQSGDLLVLRGPVKRLPEALVELGLLPLVGRDLQLGHGPRRLAPMLVLLMAMGLIGFNLVPVAVGFFGAAVLMILVGSLTLKQAYEPIDAPILVLLGALIPVSDAIRTTGGTELIAEFLSRMALALPPFGSLLLVMMTAMAVTPFLNNAATVLMMAPVAAGLAAKLGYNPDPFLMAVAIGAACDFLTPFGHQCNTLVMGPGGYRFGDYWKLGLPLSLIVLFVGVPLVMLVWPVARP
jgi:di/tricarboxylate transporter